MVTKPAGHREQKKMHLWGTGSIREGTWETTGAQVRASAMHRERAREHLQGTGNVRKHLQGTKSMREHLGQMGNTWESTCDALGAQVWAHARHRERELEHLWGTRSVKEHLQGTSSIRKHLRGTWCTRASTGGQNEERFMIAINNLCTPFSWRLAFCSHNASFLVSLPYWAPVHLFNSQASIQP